MLHRSHLLCYEVLLQGIPCIFPPCHPAFLYTCTVLLPTVKRARQDRLAENRPDPAYDLPLNDILTARRTAGRKGRLSPALRPQGLSLHTPERCPSRSAIHLYQLTPNPTP